MQFQQTKHKGLISNFTGNGIHCAAGIQYFEANLPTGELDEANQPVYQIYEIPVKIGVYSSNDAGTEYSELVVDKGNLSILATNATLSNVTVWNSNSILTLGKAEEVFVQGSGFTWSALTGKPVFANVALSGDFADLSNVPVSGVIDGGSAASAGNGLISGGSAASY